MSWAADHYRELLTRLLFPCIKPRPETYAILGWTCLCWYFFIGVPSVIRFTCHIFFEKKAFLRFYTNNIIGKTLAIIAAVLPKIFLSPLIALNKHCRGQHTKWVPLFLDFFCFPRIIKKNSIQDGLSKKLLSRHKIVKLRNPHKNDINS